MVTMHVLHKKVRVGKAPHNGGVKLVPLIESNEAINCRTGKNEVMGTILFESSQADRDRVLQAVAEERDMDDPTDLEWVEVVVRLQPV